MMNERRERLLAWLFIFLALTFFSTVSANGNTLITRGKSFTYDAENHLTGMNVSGTAVSYASARPVRSTPFTGSPLA